MKRGTQYSRNEISVYQPHNKIISLIVPKMVVHSTPVALNSTVVIG